MKRMFLIGVLAALMVLMVASVAYAGNDEGTFDQSTFLSGDAAHSGYDTSTNSCNFCHDVHGNSNYKLFIAATVTDGCMYCHDNAAVAGPDVYAAAGTAEHRTGVDTFIPDATTDSGAGSQLAISGLDNQLDCLDCHDDGPHGDGQSGVFGNAGALITDASATAFCARCHNENDGRVAGGVRTSDNTHVMAGLGVAYTEFGAATTTHALAGATSANCIDCHPSAYDGAGGDDSPHVSANYKLLKAGAGDSALDTVCRDCHVDTLNSLGVGYEY